MSRDKRLLILAAILSLLAYSSLLTLRSSFSPQQTLLGGWGAGLDASRQYIVDTGRIYTDTTSYSLWYFPRVPDQQLQVLNGMISIVAGAKTPEAALSLFSFAPYPTFFLILVVLSWQSWVAKRLTESVLPTYSISKIAFSYGLFAVFPAYTLIGPETIGYPGYLAEIYQLFFLTVLLRRLNARVRRPSHVALLSICAFALFNMYHSTSLEIGLMVGALFVLSFVVRDLTPVRMPSLVLLSVYLATGLYQNVVLINEPAGFIAYISDIRGVTDFALNAPFNQTGAYGNPATRFFGLANLIIVAAVGLFFVQVSLRSRLRGTSRSFIEKVTFWLFLSSGLPLALLYAYGGLPFVTGRFVDQLFIWVLLFCLPIVIVRHSTKRWRVVIMTTLLAGVVISTVGYAWSAQEGVPTTLNAQEFQATEFIWSNVPESEYVFTDWVRGTALMYRHKYTFGPDPYHMTQAVFISASFELFYSNNTAGLSILTPKVLGTGSYFVVVSQSMVIHGPTGPDYAYIPASPSLLRRFDTSPEYNVIYASGQTLIALSRP